MSKARAPANKFTEQQLRGFVGGKYNGLVKRLAGFALELLVERKRAAAPVVTTKPNATAPPARQRDVRDDEIRRLKSEVEQLLAERTSAFARPEIYPEPKNTGLGACPKCKRKHLGKLGPERICWDCHEQWSVTDETQPTQATIATPPQEQAAGPARAPAPESEGDIPW